MKEVNMSLNEVLKPLISELKDIASNGINVQQFHQGCDISRNIKVTVSSMVGDNKGNYEFLGFNPAFGLGHRCRVCSATYKEMQTINKFRLLGTDSDIKEYNDYVKDALILNNRRNARIAELNLLNEKLSKKERKQLMPNNRFGVIDECTFLQATNFNIWQFGPPDVLHDLAEGIIPRIWICNSSLCQRLSISFESKRKKCEKTQNQFQYLWEGRAKD
ncbi:hypothetical protein BLOT_016850 [Blomia tropicalis]|nr:hypothetical protein BLOT_016850 [Blomia tropicalis]